MEEGVKQRPLSREGTMREPWNQDMCWGGGGMAGSGESLSFPFPRFSLPIRNVKGDRKPTTSFADLTLFNFPPQPEQLSPVADQRQLTCRPAQPKAPSPPPETALPPHAAAPLRPPSGRTPQTLPSRFCPEDSPMPEDRLGGMPTTYPDTSDVGSWALKPRLLQKDRSLRRQESGQALRSHPERGPSGRSRGQAV